MLYLRNSQDRREFPIDSTNRYKQKNENEVMYEMFHKENCGCEIK